MASLTEELVKICDELPSPKAEELVKFARFLRAQTKYGQSNGDAAWENIINDARPRPKLDAFVQESLADGQSEPLDLGRL